VTRSFSIETKNQGPVRVIAIRGYLDAHTAPLFENVVAEELRAGRCRLVVDCTDLDYISSAGLGVFMTFIDEARQAGGDIKLAAIQPKVYQIFDVLGFPALFDIQASVEQAVARFDGAQEKD
jgi:anti-sigma B factor antagonist